LNLFFSLKNDDNITLWHLRLSHPYSHYLKHLFPKLFHNKNLSLSTCETCVFAKHHQSNFPIQPYKPSKHFSFIHSHVRGSTKPYMYTFSQKLGISNIFFIHNIIIWLMDSQFLQMSLKLFATYFFNWAWVDSTLFVVVLAKCMTRG
jgi:hypothetical protein